MDPVSAFGLAAAIAQFVDFGTKVASRLYEFRKSTGEVPESLRSVSDQLPLLVQSLKRTQIQDKDEEISLKPVVEGCHAQVQALQKILNKTLPSKDDSTWRRGKKALSSLNKDGDLQRINSKLAEYIRTLTYFHTTAIPDMSKLRLQPTDKERKGDRTRPAFLVKFDQDPHFIGREDVLQDIFTRFESGHHQVAIHGMARVGKSKIAIETCYRFRNRHPDAHVFWIHAGSLVRFDQSYKDIAQALSLVTPNSPNVNIMTLVRNWFNETTARWLAIFDNADDIDTLFAPTSRNNREDSQTPQLSDYLPRANVGSVIFTTRDQRVAYVLANAATTIQLPTFELPVAQAFLQSRLPSNASQDAQEELVQALDCLPLAISQAAAFIVQNAILPIDYLELLRSDEAEMKELLATESYDLSRDPEIKNSIIQTWMLSFARIQEQNSKAAGILSLMAVLDRQSVPTSLLRKEGDSKIQFMTAMGTLKAFSLVTEESQTSTYSMHRVVYLATQSWLETRGTLGAVRREALRAVFEEADIDLIGYYWVPEDNLLPHARLAATYERAEETSSSHAKLLSALASYDSLHGDLESAHAAAVEAVHIYRSIKNTESSAFLESGSMLVSTLLEREKYEEAEALSCELLSIGTSIGRMSYSIACQHAESILFQKRYSEAEQLLRQLRDRATSFNDCDAAEQIVIFRSLAQALMEDSKYSEAEEILNQGLNFMQHSCYEFTDFDRKPFQEAKAEICRNEGRWQEAVENYRECLDFLEGYSGQASRATLKCRKFLCYSLLSTSDFDEGYTTAYVGFELFMQTRGISDEMSRRFSEIMILASLAQDVSAGIAEGTHKSPSNIEIGDQAWPSLRSAFGRDTSMEQAEFHLGKAFQDCRVEFGLERESTPHLDKAYDDIWDVVRKHKSAQRSWPNSRPQHPTIHSKSSLRSLPTQCTV